MNIYKGNFAQYGAVVSKDSVTFTFAVSGDTKTAGIILFDKKTYTIAHEIDLDSSYRVGRVYSVKVSGINTKRLCYRYVADKETFMDPYAYAVVGRDKYNDLKREENDFAIYSGFANIMLDWDDNQPVIEPNDMVMYKLHMRGFTKNCGLGAGAGNYKGVIKRLPYLKELGITSLEFMPLYDFEEIFYENVTEYGPSGRVDSIKAIDKVNYWGYGAAYHLAPKASYFCGNPMEGFREMIKAIHDNGMEIIMEMSFPETVSEDYMVNCLKYYVRFYHVDGFHIIGCNAPVKRIASDAWLGSTKFLLESIPADVLEKEKGKKHLFIYDDGFMYVLRQMINHQNGSMVQFANHMKRQNEQFGFINYAANSNGFTLLDSFSYGEKHNEANGEDNRDGNNFNYSNNYGAEGKTNNKNIIAIRNKAIRNSLAATVLSQGVPLINSGDEVASSCEGNNNPYCQDNKTGWVTFSKAKDKQLIYRFLSQLTAFRKQHSCIRQNGAMTMNDSKHLGMPDMSYHGAEPWMMSISEEQKALGILFNGAYVGEEEDVYLCFNHHYADVAMALPRLNKSKRWRLVFNTADYNEEYDFEPKVIDNQQTLTVPGESVSVLVGQKVETTKKK